jgi:hypothetical protein
MSQSKFTYITYFKNCEIHKILVARSSTYFTKLNKCCAKSISNNGDTWNEGDKHT